MRAWLRKKLFRKRVLLPLIGIGVPWLWVAWQCFGPLSAITISSDTTRLTGPLTPDGQYVDYLSDARRRFEKPGAVAAKDDPWCILAGIRFEQWDPTKIDPPYPDFQPVYDAWLADHPEHAVAGGQLRSMPGTAAIQKFQLTGSTHPAIQKFLDDGRPWFEAVEDSAPKAAMLECSPNDDPSLSRVLLHREQLYRNRIQPPFLARAALRFQGGDFEAAVDDVLVVFRTAESCDSDYMIGLTVSWAIRKQACNDLIDGLCVSSRIDVNVCRDLLNLPTELLAVDEVTGLIDVNHRYVNLDLIQSFHRQPGQFLQAAGPGVGVSQSIAARYAAHQVDFDKLLRLQNDFSDQYAAALRQPTYELQMKAMPVPNYRTGNATVMRPEISWAFATADFQAQAELFVAQSFANSMCVRLPEQIAKQLNTRRVLHLATRLALWKNAKGSYPDALSEVLEMPDLPAAPDRVMLDAFTDTPFRYRRVADLYEIRSEGAPISDSRMAAMNDETWPSGWVRRDDPAPQESEHHE